MHNGRSIKVPPSLMYLTGLHQVLTSTPSNKCESDLILTLSSSNVRCLVAQANGTNRLTCICTKINKNVPSSSSLILTTHVSVCGALFILQHGSQEGKTIMQVSSLQLHRLSPLMRRDGGSHTEQDGVDACQRQNVGPPKGRAGRERAASDPRGTSTQTHEYRLSSVTPHRLTVEAA